MREKLVNYWGEILLRRGFIKPEGLQTAQKITERTGKRLVDVLLDQKLITQEILSTVMSIHYGVPIIPENFRQINIQPAALALIPKNIAQEHNILPLSVKEDILTVAMDDPGDIQLLDTLSSWSRKRIRPVGPLHGGVREAIDKYCPPATRWKRK